MDEVYDQSQMTMMAEKVILLDYNDQVIGSATKKESHLLNDKKKSLLHRAFSVFLFDPDGRLLLQKRSAEKITFPSYWANTCCSHPLYDLDGEQNGADGVIIAARRKLLQELGIQPEQVPTEAFTFLTRVHYQSPCDDTWGEHEIDYVLICQPGRKIDVDPNRNEVQEARWFHREELVTWMDVHAKVTGVVEVEEESSSSSSSSSSSNSSSSSSSSSVEKEKVSPWFRIIHDTLLHKWWDSLTDLDAVEERSKIYRAEGAEVPESEEIKE